MHLLNPNKRNRLYPDSVSEAVMQKTIAFFEQKGKRSLMDDFYALRWYDDFLAMVKQEQLFATMLTPTGYGARDSRWDTWRICEFAEILGFYGLGYWYTWQVSVLGLGPIWMSSNEAVKQRAARLLQEGGIFAFGLSEKEHGADIYASDMHLSAHPDGGYLANGRKYYIGNGNEAAIVTVFGKMADSGEYVFFVVDPQHTAYTCVQNVVASQNYVAEFELEDYPIREEDILCRGQEAWDIALNTVNVGKYNLGWASIGICTHALYEAIHHAAYRHLYKMSVTDFPHVKQLFTDAYVRLLGMKLFAARAADYMRVASREDRRYLLYNPLVKMKVTTQGEDVINLMWDVIAAKGFEKSTYFSKAAIDIRGLPKLEGTVHVNIALIVKFMRNYFFMPKSYEPVLTQSGGENDSFLFDQGPARGLSKIQFHDYTVAFARYDSPNINRFRELIEQFKQFLIKATPSEAQQRDTDFLLAVGEIFALIVYAQLILENAALLAVDAPVLEQLFDLFLRDASHYALTLMHKPSTTPAQADFCQKMMLSPIFDAERFELVWQQVYELKDAYSMAD